VLYDYAPGDNEYLDIKCGDILKILKDDDVGWWEAELNGKRGYVPRDYVEIM
jgi:growth factor receptor-binding protein 2